MSNIRSIVLIDVDEPTRDYIQCWANRTGQPLRTHEGGLVGIGDSRSISLVFVGNDPDVARLVTVCEALPSVPVVPVLRNWSVALAREHTRNGAAAVIASRCSEATDTRRRTAGVRDGYGVDLDDLIGESPQMVVLRNKIRTVAPMHSTVLLSGETGTGKGLAAKIIHQLSSRASHPYVHVDCSALSSTMIESELFGHERGAFTGAIARRAGRFEITAGGTLFLDEIGDMELSLQTRLLRVLQDREFERIGGSKTLRMDARVIAATNRDLKDEIRRGRFREDLFYRLKVLDISLPPLRERREDIPSLVLALLPRACTLAKVPVPSVSHAFTARMAAHHWRGNVRELANVLESVAIQCRGESLDAWHLDGILDDDPQGPRDERELDPDPTAPETADPGEECPEGCEMPKASQLSRSEIAAVLQSTGGNLARASRRLRVPRSTLRYWVGQHKLKALIPRD